jgi:hypothetical protein
MAASTDYGINATARYTGGLAQKLAQGLIDGRLKCWVDTFVMDSSAAGSTIQMAGYTSTYGYLPKNATIIAVCIVTDTAVAGLTVDVGDGTAGGSQKYAAASTALQTKGLIGIYGGYKSQIGTTTGDNYILLTTAVQPLAAAGTITCIVFYVID